VRVGDGLVAWRWNREVLLGALATSQDIEVGTVLRCTSSRRSDQPEYARDPNVSGNDR